MGEMYRPKGWENPYIRHDEFLEYHSADGSYEKNAVTEAYEAGADAYEEGMKKELKLHIEGDMYHVFLGGMWVRIKVSR